MSENKDNEQLETSPAKPYQPTRQERSALEASFVRQRKQKPAPSMKVAMKKDVAAISVDHVDEALGNTLLMEALGTADLDFLNGVLRQLTNLAAKGGSVIFH